ncbi:quinone oxidoreductase family protein [Polymorphum gilvum]|uniref:Oxidoreductase, zinc-binding dehydrogenase family n=1 Tax=Polymorphum gilvum (strain LMG 25793 / CGMCC 1.9160 / SL003B-26A1) TaxID=991905 RepID=F2IZU4_POLGS|nr:quinone oxidoreductase [Polymorphum gilvum]ADZ70670.1 Oxidoreductase, zinc-binding dehydrogenase family [Polymorphum gilvum SL003B-26A1]
MIQAIRIHRTGGPDVLQWEQVELGEPGPGEARIRHTAIGLNFLDTYYRTGLYPAPNGLPLIPGNEGAGVVLSVGPGISHVAPGDRVAYVGPLGAYAQERLIPADRLVKVPDGIDDKTAAGMMLKGMTARYLLRRTFKVTAETTLLFHAAAGGVGLIAGQWAAHLGATVIGTVGSDDKAELARAHGYAHVINYRSENFVERVKEITDGKGCDVVYDSVGKDTYPGSLDCLKPLGMWVSFGQSSGPITDFNLALLAQKGSLFATRPTLFTYIAARSDLEETAGDLFDVVGSGAVTIEVNQEYRLADAAQAHRDLEGRKTTGTTVLLP